MSNGKKDLLGSSYIDPKSGLTVYSEDEGSYIDWLSSSGTHPPTTTPGFEIDEFKDYWGDQQMAVNTFESFEEGRALRQSTGEKWRNATGKMLTIGSTVFLDNTIGTIIGLGNLLVGIGDDKGFNRFVSNPFSEWMNDIQRKSEEWMPNYYTRAEQDKAFTLGTANFWADKVLKNFGYAIGAAAAGALTGGGVSSMLKGGIKRAITAKFGKGVAAKLMKGNLDDALNMVNSDKATGAQFADDLVKAAKGIKASNLKSQISGSLFGAGGEARIEALNAGDEWYKEEVVTLNDLLQSGVIDQDEYRERKIAMEKEKATLENMTFLANFGLLSASNFIQFRHAFAGGYKANNALRKQLASKIIKEGGEYVPENISKLARLGKYALVGSKNILTESQEEMLQRVISTGGKSFHSKKLSGEATGTVDDYLNALGEGMADAYGTASGWEEGFIGGIIGMAGVPTVGGRRGVQWAGGAFGDVRQEMAMNRKAGEIASRLNTELAKTKDIYQSIVRHAALEDIKDAALVKEDIFNYKNAEHDQFVNSVLTFAETGKLDDLIDIFEGMKNANPEEIKEILLAAEIDPYVNKTDDDIRRSINERSDKLIERAKDIVKLKDAIDLKFPNRDNKFREEMVQIGSTIDNVDTRISDISNNLRSNNIVVDLNDLKATGDRVGEFIKDNPQKAEVEDIKKGFEDLKQLVKRRERFVEMYKETSTEEGADKAEAKLNKEAKKAATKAAEVVADPLTGTVLLNKTINKYYRVAKDDKTNNRILTELDEFGDPTDKEPITSSPEEFASPEFQSAFEQVESPTFTAYAEEVTEEEEEEVPAPVVEEPTVEKRPLEDKRADIEKRRTRSLRESDIEQEYGIVKKIGGLVSGVYIYKKTVGSKTYNAYRIIGDVGDTVQDIKDKLNKLYNTELAALEEQLPEGEETVEESEALVRPSGNVTFIKFEHTRKQHARNLGTRAAGTETTRIPILDENGEPFVVRFTSGRKSDPITKLNEDPDQRRFFSWVKRNKIRDKGYQFRLFTGPQLYGDRWEIYRQSVIDKYKELGQKAEITKRMDEGLWGVVVNKDGQFIDKNNNPTELVSDKVIFTPLPYTSQYYINGERVYNIPYNATSEIEEKANREAEEQIAKYKQFVNEVHIRLAAGQEVKVDVSNKSTGNQNLGINDSRVHITLPEGDISVRVSTTDQVEFPDGTGIANLRRVQPWIHDAVTDDSFMGVAVPLTTEAKGTLSKLIQLVAKTGEHHLYLKKKDDSFVFKPQTEGINLTPQHVIKEVLGWFITVNENIVILTQGKKTKTFDFTSPQFISEIDGFLSDKYFNASSSNLKNSVGIVLITDVDLSNNTVETDETYSGPEGYQSWLLNPDSPIVVLDSNPDYQVGELDEGRDSELRLNANLEFSWEIGPPQEVTSPTKTEPKKKPRERYRSVTHKVVTPEDLIKSQIWFEQRFPGVDFNVVKGLVDNKAWGKFHGAAVYISESAEAGTTYHEAWHVVTRMFLTEQEANELYQEYREVNNLPDTVENGEIEEKLAEDFMRWKLGEKISYFKSKKQRGFFRRLKNFIDKLLGLKKADIEEIFNRIDTGYYATRLPVRGIKGPTYRAIEKIGFDQFKTYKLNKSLAFFGLSYIFDRNHPERIASLFTNDKNPDVVRGMRDYMKSKITEYRDYYESEGETILQKELQSVLDNFEEVNTQFDEFLAAEYKLEVTEEVDEADETRSKSEMWSDSSVKRSVKSTATNNIKLLIGGLPNKIRNPNTEELKDEPYIYIYNELGLPETADFGHTFNYLVNKLAGLDSLVTMDEVLREAVDSGEMVHLSTLRDILSIGKVTDINTTVANTQNEFYQTFAKSYYEYIMGIIAEEGTSRIINATRNRVAQMVYERWASNVHSRVSKEFYSEVDSRRVYNVSAFRDFKSIENKNVFEFMDILGIDFLDKSKLSEADIKNIKDAAIQIKGAISRSPAATYPIIFDRTIDNRISGNIRMLIQIEAKAVPDIFENSHYDVNGNLVYNAGLNSFFSNIVNGINEVTNYGNLLLKFPFLNDENAAFLTNSLLLKRGGLVFDEAGDKRPGKIEFGFYTGDRQQSYNASKEFGKMTNPDKLRAKLNAFFDAHPRFLLLRTADNKLERFVSLFGKTLIPANSKYSNVFWDYLADELHRSIEVKFDTKRIVYRDDKKFDGVMISLVRDGANSTLKNNLNALIEQLDTDVNRSRADQLVTEFLERKDNRDLFSLTLKAFVDTQVNNTVEDLVKAGLIVVREDKVQNFGLSLSNLTSLTALKNHLTRSIVNDSAWKIEQTKIFFGDPISFKSLEDEYKRHASAVSTKKAVNDDWHMRLWKDKFLKRFDKRLNDGTVTTITLEDVVTTSPLIGTLEEILHKEDAGAYRDYIESDSQGLITLDEYRSIHFSSGMWTFGTNSLEELYQWEIQRAANPDKVPVYTDPYTKETHKIAKRPNLIFTPAKLLYDGPLAEDSYTKTLFKFSVMPLVPSLIKDTNLRELHDKMVDQKVGIAAFASGNKFGHKLNTDDGNVQSAYALPEKFLTQETYSRFWGVQLDIGFKAKNRTAVGTQMMKHISSGIFAQGEPKSKDLGKLFKEYVEKNGKRIDTGKKLLIKKLGLKKTEDGYVIHDLEVFKKILHKEAINREMADNIIEGLELLSENNGIDVLVNRESVEHMLFSIASNTVVKQKTFGNSAVQVAGTLFEKAGIKRVRINGKYAYISEALNFYSEGKGMKVYITSPFPERTGITVEQLQKRPELLNLIGFRIPTQGLSSVEAVTIEAFPGTEDGFLPRTVGEMVILPSEIVVKAGSDFDIDKLNLYFPNYYINSKNRGVYIRYKDDMDAAYEEYKSNVIREYDKSEALLGDFLNFAALDEAEEALLPLSKEEFTLKALENRIHEIQREILLHPSNFEELVTPLSTRHITEAAALVTWIKNGKPTKLKDGTKLEGTDTEISKKWYEKFLDSQPLHMLLDQRFNAEISERFQGGNQAVGITALYSTFLIAAQQHYAWIANNDTTRIRLLHNENEYGQISLAHEMMADGSAKISRIVTEWTSATVDAPKEPHMFNMGITLQNIDTALYLNMAGVDVITVGLFMSQPIVQEYLTAQAANESMSAEENNRSISKKALVTRVKGAFTPARITEIKTTNKIFSQEDLIKLLEKNNKKATWNKEFIGQQYQILNDFLRYQQTSRSVNVARNALDFDTNAAGKNISEMLYRLAMVDRALYESVIENFDKMLGTDKQGVPLDTGSFLYPYYKAVYDLQEVFKPLSRILSNETLIKLLNDRIDSLARLGITSKSDIIKHIDLWKQDLFTYLLQTAEFTVNGIEFNLQNDETDMFYGKNNMALRLEKMKEKYPQNTLLKSLTPVFPISKFFPGTKVKQGVGISYHSSKLDKIELNQLINDWEQLLTEPFGIDLIKFSIMQTGLQNSPMSFWHLIPAKIYNDIFTQLLIGYDAKSIDEKAAINVDFDNQVDLQNHTNRTMVQQVKKGSRPNDWMKYFSVGRLIDKALTKAQQARLIVSGIRPFSPLPHIFENDTKQEVDPDDIGVHNPADNQMQKKYRSLPEFKDTSYEVVEPEEPTVKDVTEETTFLQKEPSPLSQLKKELGIRNSGYEYSDLQKNMLLKRVGLYNTEHSTVHRAISTKIGDADLYKIEFIPDPQLPLFQMETAEEHPALKTLDAKITGFLNRMGIQVKSVESIEVRDKNGNELDAIAKADILRKIVSVVEGKAKIDTLPEEAAHFLVELLGDHPLVQKMMREVEEYKVYDETVAEYSHLEEYQDEDKLRKEAVGKLIAKYIIAQETGEELPEKIEKVNSWWRNLWNYIISKFKRVTSAEIEEVLNPFREAARMILEEDVSQLDLANILDNPLVFYDLAPEVKEYRDRVMESAKRKLVTHDQKTKAYYRTADGIRVLHRVTQLVKEQVYEKIFGIKDRLEEEDRRAAKAGIVIHKVMELNFTKAWNNEKLNYGNTMDETWEQVKDLAEFKEMTREEFNRIIPLRFFNNAITDTLNGIAEQIRNTEERITETTGEPSKPAIYTEFATYNSRTDIAGTVDLMVIHSNGTASIFDWKSMLFEMVGPEAVSGVAWFKRKAFDVQLGYYREALEEEYGITEFAMIRVVPLAMNLNKNGEIVELQSGYSDPDNEHLKLVPSDLERTKYKRINKTLDQLFKKRNELLAIHLQNIRNQKVIKSLDRLDEIIRKLQTEHDVMYVLNELVRLNKYVADREHINDPLDADGKRNKNFISNDENNELREFLGLLDGFGVDAVEHATEMKDVKMAKELQRIPYLIEKLKDKLNTIGVNRAQSGNIGELKGRDQKYQTVDLTEVGERSGLLTRWFGKPSQFKHPIMKMLSSMITGNYDYIYHQMKKLRKDFEKLTKDLKKWANSNGMSLMGAFKKIYDPETGNLVGRISSQYYDDKEKAGETRNHKWFIDNTEIQAEEIDDVIVYKYVGNARERFDKAIENYTEFLNNRYRSHAEGESKIKKSLAFWNSRNNISKNPNALFDKKNKFIRLKPDNTKYESAAWQYINAHAPLKAYYNYWINLMRELNELTDREINEKFVANLPQDILDRVARVGDLGIGQLKATILQTLQLQQDDILRGTIDIVDPETREKTRSVPLSYYHRLREPLPRPERNKIIAGMESTFVEGTDEYNNELEQRIKFAEIKKARQLKSIDLSKVGLLFAEAVYTHHAFSATEDAAKNLRHLLTNAEQSTISKDSSGNPIKDRFTNKIATVLGIPHGEVEVFDKFVNMHWYRVSAGTWDFNFKAFGRQFSLVKLIHNLNRFIQLKAMGVSPFLAGGNFLGATSNLFMMATEGRYFQAKHVRKSIKMLVNKDPKTMALIGFFEPYAHDLTVLKADKLSATALTKHATMEAAFAMHRWGDVTVDNLNLLSELQFFGIDPADGQIKRLSEIKKGGISLLDTAELTDEGIKIKGLGENELTFSTFRKQVRIVSGKIKGSMPEDDKNTIGANIITASMMMFKNWMPGLISTRFKNFDTDELGEFDVGRFRVAFGEFTAKGFLPKLKAFTDLAAEVALGNYLRSAKFGIKPNKEVSRKYYNEYLKANRLTADELSLKDFMELRRAKLRSMAAELRIYFSFMLLIFGTRAMLPDDEDDPMYKMAIIGYRMLNRGYLEVSFFLDPRSVTQVSYSLPQLRLFTDIYKLVANTVEEAGYLVTGYKPTKAEDRARVGYYSSKMVPVFNKFYDFIDYWNTYNPDSPWKY